MDNSQIIDILRHRTAIAILNYYGGSDGRAICQHGEISISITYTDIKAILLEEIDLTAWQELDKDNVNLFLIDTYSDLLSEDSTGENINDCDAKLSKSGIELAQEIVRSTGEMITKGAEYEN